MRYPEIAKILGVSAERVRQITAAALAKLGERLEANRDVSFSAGDRTIMLSRDASGRIRVRSVTDPVVNTRAKRLADAFRCE